ncbi:nucleoside-diphosphate kinase [Candidatus Micrarchaeota archaeon]|jgi:nucleoside-diphosphate kinase|nr:nucleoside-diphosphate kinase [Candidatus Micrarchaeota archaeon]
MRERTLVLIKPDAVERELMGVIINRFERIGLDITRMRMIKPTVKQAERHYNKNAKWCLKVGKKTIEEFTEKGICHKTKLGTTDPEEIGKDILERLINYLTRGKIVAMVIEGPHAIDIVRKIVGDTYPLFAAPGTIRGDYGIDTAFLSAYQRRSVENLIHASENKKDAEREIKIWFGNI